jgi:hypothetical protein
MNTPRADSAGSGRADIAARFGRMVPLAGAGSAILTVAGYLVIGPNPDSESSTSTIAAYYEAHHAHVFAAGILLMYSTILFAMFGVAVWERIRRTALHPVVAGIALLATAVATASNLANASAWYVLGNVGNTHGVSPGALQTLHLSVSVGDLPSVAGIGMLLLAFALAGILAGAFPRWLAWAALVLGIVQLTPTPGVFGFLAGLLILPWMFAAGIAMFVQRPSPAPAPAESSTALGSPALTGG